MVCPFRNSPPSQDPLHLFQKSPQKKHKKKKKKFQFLFVLLVFFCRSGVWLNALLLNLNLDFSFLCISFDWSIWRIIGEFLMKFWELVAEIGEENGGKDAGADRVVRRRWDPHGSEKCTKVSIFMMIFYFWLWVRQFFFFYTFFLFLKISV